MSKALQLRHGTTAEHLKFTGLPSEITIDTDKNTVVVHDGLTAGGYPMSGGTGGAGVQPWTTYNSALPIVSGDKLLVDTAPGPVTVILPAGVFGESISFYDATGSFAVNPLTVVSTAGETFMGTPSPLTHRVSRTLVLTSINADWRF